MRHNYATILPLLLVVFLSIPSFSGVASDTQRVTITFESATSISAPPDFDFPVDPSSDNEPMEVGEFGFATNDVNQKIQVGISGTSEEIPEGVSLSVSGYDENSKDINTVTLSTDGTYEDLVDFQDGNIGNHSSQVLSFQLTDVPWTVNEGDYWFDLEYKWVSTST
ncbi:MAG: hypothetical protein ACLFVS_04265 [Candidatus Acetothermia bacterium]